MFRIHEHQLAHFQRKVQASFEARMASWLTRAYAECFVGMPEAEIAAWVNSGVNKAIAHGFVTEPEVAALLVLFLVLGVDADETTPWAREVLLDRKLLPEGKVRVLVTRAREHGVPGIDAIDLGDDAPHAHDDEDDRREEEA